jgi:hypothetical protein
VRPGRHGVVLAAGQLQVHARRRGQTAPLHQRRELGTEPTGGK